MGEIWPCKFQSLHIVSKSEKEMHMKQRHLKPLGSAHVTAVGDPGTSLCKLCLILSKTRQRMWLKLCLWSGWIKCQWSHCRAGQSGAYFHDVLSAWCQNQTLQSSWVVSANMVWGHCIYSKAMVVWCFELDGSMWTGATPFMVLVVRYIFLLCY